MIVQMCVLVFIIQGHHCIDLTYYVEEGKSPNTYLGDIAADSNVIESVPFDDRNEVTFSLLTQGVTGTSLFHVSKESGKLYTAQTLDAETLCTYNAECFQMVDIAVKKSTTVIKLLEVKVIIQDINDHQPEFPEKQINMEFSERDIPGTKISIPNAVDRDVNIQNSEIIYVLKKGKDEPFTLLVSERVDGSSQLSINLEDKLDRETKDVYKIQVIAKNKLSPSKKSVLDIHITVIDENDNPPIFSDPVYNVTVKNKPDAALPITILSAQDLDLGTNGKISYSFNPKTLDIAKSHFELKSETGEIFLVKKFSTGQKLQYKLFVKASDGGNPPLSSLAMVQVNVMNEQNNAPTIKVTFFSSSTKNTVDISEDIKVGSFIAYVKVTDPDSGQNGDISCNLNHDKFQLQSLDTKKYQVIVKKPLDRETQGHHDIIVHCKDKGSPALESERIFSVRVMDVNDEKPQFSRKTFRFKINENQKS